MFALHSANAAPCDERLLGRSRQPPFATFATLSCRMLLGIQAPQPNWGV